MPGRRNAIYALTSGCLLAGLFTGRAAFFSIGFLLLVLLLVAWLWAWLSVRGISLGRFTRARRSQVGRTFTEAFRVLNRAWLPKLWLDVRDHSDLPGHRAGQVIPPLNPRRDHTWTVETPCRVRGEFTLGPLTLTGGDPFGMFTITRHINATERMIVYPATVPVEDFFLPSGLLSGGEAQRQLTHQTTTNAAGVREYVPGDSINRVHWRSTARRGKLIVKEFEVDPLVDIWLFVDFSSQSLVEEPGIQRVGRTGTVLPGGYLLPPSTEEYAVVIAASLAQYFLELERSLGFAAYVPHREVYQPERGTRQTTHIMETLAVARSLSNHSLQEMLALEAPGFARGTTLIIVTASLDARWVAEAQVLMRRGIRPVGVLIDPSSFGAAPAPDELRGLLHLARIPTLTIRKGDNLSSALRQRPFL
ncbi:MAG: DUF58 domain-containing protein [Anaerolineae bacterium]|jgi:uncharacterized protein (DUF58 family)|nr:DUF58 domain-containing protein [Anaerolineae bacterium]